MILQPVALGETDDHASSSVLKPAEEDVRARRATAQDVLTTVGETIYEWDLLNDRIRWGANAADVLGISDMRALSTGSAFGSLLHPDSVTDRHQAVLNGIGVDYGAGVPFDVTYAIRLQTEVGLRTVWLQDCGVWFAGAEGAPYLARGIVRLCRTPVGRGAGVSTVRELPRRGSFLRMVNNILAMAAHYRTGHAVVAMSVDNLALVARSYGVPAIEEMEAVIAERIRAVVRGGDLVGWLGECELGLVLTIGDDREAAQAVDRIVKAVGEQPIVTSAGPINALVSAGAVIAPFQASGLLPCLARAREAQAKARATGPGHFAFFQQEGDGSKPELSEVEIAVIVGRALGDAGVRLVFRSAVRAADGAEAFLLCRPEFRAGASPVVSWDEAARVACSVGLCGSVDRAVLTLAIDFLSKNPPAVLLVPVFSETLRATGFAAELLARLAGTDVRPERLVLAIGEPELQADGKALAHVLKALRQGGCGLAMSEFGSSFVSARLLKTYGFDYARIDPAFAETGDGGARQDLRRLVDGVHAMGAEVIAPAGMPAAEAIAAGADVLVAAGRMTPGSRRSAKSSAGTRSRGRKVA